MIATSANMERANWRNKSGTAGACSIEPTVRLAARPSSHGRPVQKKKNEERVNVRLRLHARH